MLLKRAMLSNISKNILNSLILIKYFIGRKLRKITRANLKSCNNKFVFYLDSQSSKHIQLSVTLMNQRM